MHQLQHVARNAGVPQGLHHHRAAPARLGGGFDDHRAARRERGQRATRGDGDREVPRRRHDGEPHRHRCRAVDAVECLGKARIEIREVDGFGDLGVALVEGLTALGGHHLEQCRPAGLEARGRAAEDDSALGPGERRPVRPRTDPVGDHRVECVRVGDGVLVHQCHPGARVRNALGDRPPPVPVSGQRGIGVGNIAERLARRRRRVVAAPVLAALRRWYVVQRGRIVQSGQRRHEPVPLALKQCVVAMQFEDGRHEVVLAGALLEPAHQVGDRDVEVLRMNHGHVEQQTADRPAYRLGLRLGHAQQHLELDAVADPAAPGQRPRVGDVEQVVTGDADPHVLGAVRAQRVVQDSLVVGVGVLLGVPGGQGPAVQRRLDVLHRQVGPLDQADLDGGAAPRPAGPSPVLQPDHRRQRIGQVGLEHDAGFQVEQLGPVQQPGEHGERELEIAVLLHVQVDELAIR